MQGIDPLSLLLTAGLLIYGLYRLYRVYTFYHKIYTSANWPQAFGTITDGKVKRISSGRGGAHHRAEFSFTYKVLGSEFAGDFKIDSFLGLSNTAAKDVQEHPAGITLPVHYNPDKPGEYTTEFDKVSAYEWFQTALVLFLGGLSIFIMILNRGLF
jgi:hypothetical protein